MTLRVSGRFRVTTAMPAASTATSISSIQQLHLPVTHHAAGPAQATTRGVDATCDLLRGAASRNDNCGYCSRLLAGALQHGEPLGHEPAIVRRIAIVQHGQRVDAVGAEVAVILAQF